jgi:glycosyltransferase involved in cell wall biosynthesis
MLPLLPAAVAFMRVPDDVSILISSDASFIKGISLSPGTKHICYCYSPPRYIWELSEVYAASLTPWQAMAFRASLPFFRLYDTFISTQVDRFIAISRFVRNRIRLYYGRDACVIYPPVQINMIDVSWDHEDYYLVVCALVPYKRIDLVVTAFNKRSDRRLVVIGSGPELDRLRACAKSNISLLGHCSNDEVQRHLRQCRAFLFPQVEDFGIAPLEANAAGKPVIAYRAGAAPEIIIDGMTGMFFDEQTPDALNDCLDRFESGEVGFNPNECRRQAALFGPERFRNELAQFLRNEGVETG